MKQYLSFFRMRLVAGLQYRAAALAGMSTQFVWGTLEVLVYRAFWLESPEKFPMGMEALASYIWLQQAFLAFFSLWQWEAPLMDAVQSGDIAYELTRPTDLYGMWMARSMALRLSRAALRCWPILLVAAFIPAPYGLRLPASLAAFGLFLVSMALMLTVVCALVLVIYALGFTMESTRGVRWLALSAADLLGGAVVPLPFLPEPLRTFAALSPFGAMQNVPLRIYSGDLAGGDLAAAMGLQAFWCVFLIALGARMTRSGVRRTVVAGG